MKNIFFCLLALLCITNSSYAAFPVKAAPATTNAAVVTTTEQGTTVKSKEHTGFFTRIKNRVANILPDGGWEHGEGMRAMFWALWGLFIWPLGILAIVHGIRGLHSRSGREQDRATLGLILGIGEVLACVLFVMFFFFFVF